MARRRPDASIALHLVVGAILPLTFCGSKAGATFSLAMISTGGGLESLTSQRCRNNCLTLEMEDAADKFFWLAAPPHPGVSGGGGDVERSHGSKLDYSQYM